MRRILFILCFIGLLFLSSFLLKAEEHRRIFFMLILIAFTIFYIIIYYRVALKKKKNIFTAKEVSIDSPESQIKDYLGNNFSQGDISLVEEILNKGIIREKTIYYELLRSYMGIEQYDIKDFQTVHRNEIIGEILRLQNSNYFEYERNCHKGLRIYMDKNRITGIDMLEKMGEKELLEAIIKCENRLTEIFKKFRYVLKIADGTKFFDSSPKILLETENKEDVIERFVYYLKNPIKDKKISLDIYISNFDKISLYAYYVKNEDQLIKDINKLEKELTNRINV